MDTKGNDFKLGAFVLVGFGLLTAGLFAFGAVSYFQRMTLAETYVAGNVDGLAVGAPVTLRGVNVGKVTRIDFHTPGIFVQRIVHPASFDKRIEQRTVRKRGE